MVCMAKADGVLRPAERFLLEDALAGLALPEGLTASRLLEEDNDPQALARSISTPEGRDYAYASVYALAYCDRELAAAEERILEILRAEWGIGPQEDEALRKALDKGQPGESFPPPAPAPAAVKEAGARGSEFQKLLSRYALLTGLTGAIPVPLLPDLLVVPMQVKLIHDIAALFGLQTDKATVQLMFETLGVGTGVRLGVSGLCKMVPGWGSLVGAASSFATTYALGKVAWAFFESEGKRPLESFRPLFLAEHKQGKEEFKKHQAALVESRRIHAKTLKALAYDLHQGKITQQQYEEKVDRLA